MIFRTKSLEDIKADTVIYFIFEDVNKKNEVYKFLNEQSNKQLAKQLEYGLVTGSFLETTKIAINKDLKVLLVGLGKKNELTRQKYSQALATAARAAKTASKNKIIAIRLIENTGKNIKGYNSISKIESIMLSIPALRIGLYDFDKYLSNKKPKIEEVEIIENSPTAEIEKAVLTGAHISNAMTLTKDLVNEPAQNVTPEYMVEIAQNIARENNLEIEIYDVEKLQEIGMNGLLAVGQGSINEPKFVHLSYVPKSKPRKKIALIGKGITFDAGGMNIKPATSMLTMKSDMTGSATVLSIIQAISSLNADIELHAICALCENMTSGKAYKQGDVIRAMNGKTIEVDNTDAEGRITLADALSYADTLDVDEVIDIATLTGAVIVALGNNITGVLGNNQNQIKNFMQSAKAAGENVWQMPILDELKDNLKSEIADMKNTGGRNAGTSTAGWFLSNFTKSKSWLHLDIAGTAYLEKSNKETLNGPTGVMIRSLMNYILG